MKKKTLRKNFVTSPTYFTIGNSRFYATTEKQKGKKPLIRRVRASSIDGKEATIKKKNTVLYTAPIQKFHKRRDFITYFADRFRESGMRKRKNIEAQVMKKVSAKKEDIRVNTYIIEAESRRAIAERGRLGWDIVITIQDHHGRTREIETRAYASKTDQHVNTLTRGQIANYQLEAVRVAVKQVSNDFMVDSDAVESTDAIPGIWYRYDFDKRSGRENTRQKPPRKISEENRKRKSAKVQRRIKVSEAQLTERLKKLDRMEKVRVFKEKIERQHKK